MTAIVTNYLLTERVCQHSECTKPLRSDNRSGWCFRHYRSAERYANEPEFRKAHNDRLREYMQDPEYREAFNTRQREYMRKPKQLWDPVAEMECMEKGCAERATYYSCDCEWLCTAHYEELADVPEAGHAFSVRGGYWYGGFMPGFHDKTDTNHDAQTVAHTMMDRLG